MRDLISRQAAIDALGERPIVWTDDDQYTLGERNQYDIDRLAIETLPSAQPERWTPVAESLPEEDADVLISYRYKEGEGDTSHVYIDITSYGDMYFGGRKVKGAKHWRPPFEYFTSNYDVIAWMPLPEPWRGEEDD